MRDFISQHAFGILVIILAVSIACHLVTVSYSPVRWQDEVQISAIAQGGIGEKSQDYSLAMLRVDGTNDTQAWAVYYLGGWIVNQFYEAFGCTAPRIGMLAFLCCLTFLVYWYSKIKLKSKIFALVFAVLVLTLPEICQGVRGARVDVLAFTFAMGAMCLVNIPVTSLVRERWLYFCAGCLFSLSVFTWITSVMLGCVVLCELIDVQIERRRNLKLAGIALVCALAGFTMTSIVVLAPFLSHLAVTVENIRWVVNYNTNGNLAKVHHPEFRWLLFFRGISGAPFFMAIGSLLLFCRRRSLIVAIGFVLWAVFCMLTKVYVFRMVYFWMFALVGIVYFIRSSNTKCVRSVLLWILVSMATVGFVRSVLLRNVVESFAREFRDYNQVVGILRERIGEGRQHRVYIDTFELGYVGRDLGWKTDRSGGMAFEPLLVKRCDYFIARADRMTDELKSDLSQAGFSYSFGMPSPAPSKTNAIQRVIISRGLMRSLGPYAVYHNENKH